MRGLVEASDKLMGLAIPTIVALAKFVKPMIKRELILRRPRLYHFNKIILAKGNAWRKIEASLALSGDFVDIRR